jgi:hypothetical protein
MWLSSERLSTGRIRLSWPRRSLVLELSDLGCNLVGLQWQQEQTRLAGQLQDLSFKVGLRLGGTALDFRLEHGSVEELGIDLDGLSASGLRAQLLELAELALELGGVEVKARALAAREIEAAFALGLGSGSLETLSFPRLRASEASLGELLLSLGPVLKFHLAGDAPVVLRELCLEGVSYPAEVDRTSWLPVTGTLGLAELRAPGAELTILDQRLGADLTAGPLRAELRGEVTLVDLERLQLEDVARSWRGGGLKLDAVRFEGVRGGLGSGDRDGESDGDDRRPLELEQVHGNGLELTAGASSMTVESWSLPGGCRLSTGALEAPELVLDAVAMTVDSSDGAQGGGPSQTLLEGLSARLDLELSLEVGPGLRFGPGALELTVQEGSVEIEELERGLAALVGMPLKLELVDDRLTLGLNVPLVSWQLEGDELDLARDRRELRLGRLVAPRGGAQPVRLGLQASGRITDLRLALP